MLFLLGSSRRTEKPEWKVYCFQSEIKQLKFHLWFLIEYWFSWKKYNILFFFVVPWGLLVISLLNLAITEALAKNNDYFVSRGHSCISTTGKKYSSVIVQLCWITCTQQQHTAQKDLRMDIATVNWRVELLNSVFSESQVKYPYSTSTEW